MNLQVQRIEEEDQVFSLEVAQLDVLESAIDDSGAFKVRSWVLDSGSVQLARCLNRNK